MPTLEHNALVEMFRDNPALAPHLLATLFDIDAPPRVSVAVVESSLDQLIPMEFRADLVLELWDARDQVVLAIVLEVQNPPLGGRLRPRPGMYRSRNPRTVDRQRP